MRKLLILMLVLGFAASAGATWVDPTNTDVTWTLDLINSQVIATAASGAVGSYYGVYIQATTGSITPSTGTDSGTNGVWNAAGDLAGIATAGTWYTPSSDESNDPDPAQAAGKWFSFDYVLSGGELSVDFYDSAGTMHTAALVVPEPMTIVLLGLGGLFLRRRKVA